MKPNDPKWVPACDKMVKVLTEKLTTDELYELWSLVFCDPPGGPFSDRLSAAAMKAKPEMFVEEDDQ